MSKPNPSKPDPSPSLEPKRISFFNEKDINLVGHIMWLDTAIKDAYNIEQVFNIVSIIPKSKRERSKAITVLKKVGYDEKNIWIKSESFPFYVFEEFSPIKFTFGQFMNKCYNVENIKKDSKPTFVSGHTKNLMEISFLDNKCKVKMPTKLLVAQGTNPDLLVRFKREYKLAFEYLKSVFLSACGTRCKILHVMRRKKKWETIGNKRFCLKIIPEGTTEKEKQPVIEVD